jgi:hypothetical protein
MAIPESGAAVSISGCFPDDYFVMLCSSLVPVGQQLEINGTLYIRTPEGLVTKV